MRKSLSAIVLLFCFNVLIGQDIHFSQFYNSPLTLNPALTGKMNGTFRFAMNYRNQWFTTVNGTTPFATYAGSFDAPIRLNNNDAVGLGVVLMNDRSAEGRLNNMFGLFSAAYHKSLGKEGKHALSLGVQGGMNQKRLNISELQFFNQFDQSTGSFSQISTENISNDKVTFFDLNAGLMANSQITKKANAYVGFAMFHLTQPKESFLATGDENLPIRYVVHGGAEYVFHKRIALLPSAIYMRQRVFDELNVGAAFVFKMMENENTLFYLGGYYRMLPSSKQNEFNFSDAAIFYTAFEYRNFRLAFSYDASTSDIRNAPKPVGAFEVSVTYVYPLLPDLKNVLFCPRF